MHSPSGGVGAAAPPASVSQANQSVWPPPPGAPDPATVTATVSSSGTVNGGTVSFFDNGVLKTCVSGNQTVASGTATCGMTFTQEGTHPITPTYNGTSGFPPPTTPNNPPPHPPPTTPPST